MAERSITFLSTAWSDIEQIGAKHMRLVGPKAADKITDKLLDNIYTLALFPFLGPIHPDPELAQQQYRKLVCGNYICVYKVLNDEVVVYRVVDGRTDYPKHIL